jgi:hypothetical protein
MRKAYRRQEGQGVEDEVEVNVVETGVIQVGQRKGGDGDVAGGEAESR